MANRIPLIVNANAGQVQELDVADNLDLSSSSIIGVNTLTANTVSANSINVSGNLTVSGYLTGNDSLLTGITSVSAVNPRLIAIIFGR